MPGLGLPAWRGRRGCGHLCRAAFAYGQFVTAAGSFLISALVACFIVVMAVSRLLQLPGRNRAATTRDCPRVHGEHPVAARRCPECTAEIAPATEQPQPVGRIR